METTLTTTTPKPPTNIAEFKAEDLGKKENLQAQIKYMLEERRKHEV